MNGGPTYREAFFGEEWTDVAEWLQVTTPVGMKCVGCGKEIVMGDQGIHVRVERGPYIDIYALHRGCPQPDSAGAED